MDVKFNLQDVKTEQAFPSSTEINTMINSDIDSVARRRVCLGAKRLHSFIQDTASNFITPKGSEETTIIDQKDRITYKLGGAETKELFSHLEECRLEGTIMHFSERQGTVSSPKSGIMIDYDMKITNPKPLLTDRFYYRMSQSLVAMLQKDIDFTTTDVNNFKFHIFFIIKPEAVPIECENGTQLYKYGFHMLIPGLQMSRAYKKLLIHNFKSDTGGLSALRELGISGDIKECLDQNSASVPVLFIGSCKRGGVPYVLGAALEIEIEPSSEDWAPPPVIRKMRADELANYNLVAELSLTVEAEYNDKSPLVKMVQLNARNAIMELAQSRGLRFADNINNQDELKETEADVSILNMTDPQFRHIKGLLDMLDITYCTERNKWRNVIFALANTNEKYKTLAIWFSQKCPKKWINGGLESLDTIWDTAVAQAPASGNVLTIKSLEYWARKCNPTKYKEITNESYASVLFEYVMDTNGKLQHYMLAKNIILDVRR